MRKTINAVRLRSKLGQVLEEVYYRGDQYVIERAGKPMAVVIPVEQYEQWRRKRQELFTLIDEMRARALASDPDEIERDIAEAVREARARQ
jgi:prevent-host-death family protein